ncbi:hypothetical protein CAEBREN_10473 [Caenorhabditis brenneri]|uniref:Ubiquitin-like protease family profile domain-containing protein n=1 Tax=Caenorhabditis brenneri TaxID=135651 RepID=G0N3J8_CAEBE|nr:hypothetical protein CAEBREN_10473 [Caenorhabditis brenneri]
MSDRSDNNDEEDQSRKRPWLFGKEEQKEQPVTPSKRQKKNEKSKGLGGYLLHPLTSLYGMLYGEDKKKKKKPQDVYEEEEVQDDDILISGVSPRKTDRAGSIIYLNADSPEDAESLERAEAGGEEVLIERHIQRNVEVSDDSESDEIQEVPVEERTPQKLERSFEVQQDDEPDVIYSHVVKTPNKQLMEARKFENELIYLNDRPETPESGSVASGPISQSFASPTPDESVSRPRTPISSSLSNYSSNNVRDFWRRSAKKTTSQKGTPVRQQFRYTGSIQRVNTTNPMKHKKQSEAKKAISSRDRLLQGVISSGQYDAPEISAILTDARLQQSSRMPKKAPPSADLMARARNKIRYLQSSRSTTPSISRESSVIFEGTSQRRAPSPSTSLASSVTSSTHAATNQKINEILFQIDNLGFRSAHRGPQRYEIAFEQTRRAEDIYREEARIREGHRVQTRGDGYADLRNRLEIQGIAIRPKLEKKKKVDDFMGLPDAADRLIERAWNKTLAPNEKFVEAFSIEIYRKDLLTLSGLHWLNDNIINYYLQLICDRSVQNPEYPKTYAFNTFFYTNIITKGYASVKRWTRKVDIFSYEIILVPVHLGMHWCMAVIDMVERKIEFYDSLYDGNTAVLPALKKYIAEESADKKKVQFDFTDWEIYQMEEIPRQQNGSDCGVFSCQFGEWASRRQAPRFTQKNMPYYRKRMAYEIVEKKLLATI